MAKVSASKQIKAFKSAKKKRYTVGSQTPFDLRKRRSQVARKKTLKSIFKKSK